MLILRFFPCIWLSSCLFCLPTLAWSQEADQAETSLSRLSDVTEQLNQAVTLSNIKRADSLILLGDELLSNNQNVAERLAYKTARGEHFRYNSRFAEALAQHQEVMQLSAGREEHQLTYAYAIFYIGLSFESLASYDSSLWYMDQALPLFESLLEPDDTRFSGIYKGIASAYYRANRLDESEAYFLKSKAIAEILGPQSPELADALFNLSAISRKNGEYQQAIQYTEQALKIYRVLGDEQGISSSYYSLGVYHYYLGDYGRAIEYIEACLDIRGRLFSPLHASLIGPYQVLGIAQDEAGNYRKTLEYLKKIRKIILANYPPKSLREGLNYDNTALCYQSLGVLDSALYFVEKAESIVPGKISSTHLSLANHYFTYANILYQLGKWEQARQQLAKSDRILEAINLLERGEYAQNLSLAGLIDAANGNWKQAETAFDRALAIQQLSAPKLETLSSLQLSPDIFKLLNEYTDFLFQQYQATQDPSSLNRFESYSTLYLELSDRFRKQFSDPYTKSILIKDNAAVYDRNIGIYHQLYQQTQQNKYLEAAYQCSEFGRTCLLRDLQDEKIESYAGLPDSVLQKDRSLKKQLTELNQQLLDDPADEEIRQQLMAAREALDAHLAHTLDHYPRYYALRYQAHIPSLTDVQSHLAEGENLIEYMQDDTAYYALVVHPTNYEWVYVGNREQINGSINAWKNGIIQQEEEAVKIAGMFLYQHLWQSIEPYLKGEEVSIIPAGPLFYLNFETLPIDPEAKEYLIETYTISYALSAAVLFSANQEKETGLMMAIAPGFEDEIKQQYQQQIDSLETLDEAYLRTIRQPWSVKLVKQLQDTYALQGFTGQRATESTLKKHLLEGQILYFGTHAIANPDDPMRSKLVLAKEIGSQTEDGYLHAYELFGLPLQAELAILNACETGLGNLQRGEGMISLAYSIHSAGCPSTVMSLWKVDEKISTQLTDNFLAYLNQGLTRRTALRQAKLDVLHTSERTLHHPFFWGGMVLMGKNGHVDLPHKGIPWYVWLMGAGLIGLLVMLGMRTRQFRRNKA